MKISQDVEIYQTIIQEGKSVKFEVEEKYIYWIQIALGVIEIDNNILEAGDGVAIKHENKIFELKGIDKTSNIVIFKLKN